MDLDLHLQRLEAAIDSLELDREMHHQPMHHHHHHHHHRPQTAMGRHKPLPNARRETRTATRRPATAHGVRWAQEPTSRDVGRHPEPDADELFHFSSSLLGVPVATATAKPVPRESTMIRPLQGVVHALREHSYRTRVQARGGEVGSSLAAQGTLRAQRRASARARTGLAKAEIERLPVFHFELAKIERTPIALRRHTQPSMMTPHPKPTPKRTRKTTTQRKRSRTARPTTAVRSRKPRRRTLPDRTQQLLDQVEASLADVEQRAAQVAPKKPNPGITAPEDLSCCICIEEVVAGDALIRLACQHVFHATCVKDWLKRVNACPLCKRLVRVPAVRPQTARPLRRPRRHVPIHSAYRDRLLRKSREWR